MPTSSTGMMWGVTQRCYEQFQDCVHNLSETLSSGIQQVRSIPDTLTGLGLQSNECEQFTSSRRRRLAQKSLSSSFRYSLPERRAKVREFYSNSRLHTGRLETRCTPVKCEDTSSGLRVCVTASADSTDGQGPGTSGVVQHSDEIQAMGPREVEGMRRRSISQQDSLVAVRKYNYSNQKRTRDSSPNTPEVARSSPASTGVVKSLIERTDYSTNGWTPELLQNLNKRQRVYSSPIQQRNDILKFREMKACNNTEDENGAATNDIVEKDSLSASRAATTATSTETLPEDSSMGELSWFQFSLQYTDSTKTITVSPITVKNVKGTIHANIYLSHGWDGHLIDKQSVNCVGRNGKKETSKRAVNFVGISLHKTFDMILRVKLKRHGLLRNKTIGETVVKLNDVLSSECTIGEILNTRLNRQPED